MWCDAWITAARPRLNWFTSYYLRTCYTNTRTHAQTHVHTFCDCRRSRRWTDGGRCGWKPGVVHTLISMRVVLRCVEFRCCSVLIIMIVLSSVALHVMICLDRIPYHIPSAHARSSGHADAFANANTAHCTQEGRSELGTVPSDEHALVRCQSVSAHVCVDVCARICFPSSPPTHPRIHFILPYYLFV